MFDNLLILINDVYIYISINIFFIKNICYNLFTYKKSMSELKFMWHTNSVIISYLYDRMK